MNQSMHPSRHPFVRFYAAPALLLLLVFGVSPGAAQGQWVTNGDNISNTNTGNVGIGTTAPAAKLEVNGSATFSGPTTVAGRGTFFIDNNNSLNFSTWFTPLKINSPSVSVNGALETFDNYFGVRHTPNNTLTVYIPSAGSAYFNQGNVGIGTATPNGKLDVLGTSGAPNFATGLTGVLRVGASNEHIEFGYVAGSRNWIQGFGAVPLYINEGGNNVILNSGGGNVGIGQTSPAYKLDVNGEINATGLRINGTPVGASGQSQWTTNGSNIHFNTGSIGIGTTTPAAPLHVLSNNANVLFGNISSGYGAIGFQNTLNVNNFALTGSTTQTVLNTPAGTSLSLRVNNSTTNTLVLNSSGNVGIGTETPATRLEVRTPSQVNDGFQLAGSDSHFLMLRPSSSAGAHNNLVQNGDTALIYGGNGVGTGSLVIAPWVGGNPSGIKMDGSGNVGIGTATPSARLDVNGNINVSGNINAKYQDVAEWVESSQQLEAGTVVALDPEKSNQVLASSEAYDTKVAGVISARPGISLGERGESKVLVATTGRVKVRVDATRAPIKIGDLLVTSDVPGVAMKSEPVSIGGRRMHLPGTLIGKALEPLEKGTGEILVLLSLQ